MIRLPGGQPLTRFAGLVAAIFLADVLVENAEGHVRNLGLHHGQSERLRAAIDLKDSTKPSAIATRATIRPRPTLMPRTVKSVRKCGVAIEAAA
jgi:hypothetical protein